VLSFYLPVAVADEVVAAAVAGRSVHLIGEDAGQCWSAMAALVSGVGARCKVAGLWDRGGEHPCVVGHERSLSLQVPPEWVPLVARGKVSLGIMLAQHMIDAAVVVDPPADWGPVLADVVVQRPLWIATPGDRALPAAGDVMTVRLADR